MSEVYAIVDSEMPVTAGTQTYLRQFAHELLLGNPTSVLCWRARGLGPDSVFVTTDVAEAARFLAVFDATPTPPSVPATEDA